MPYSRQSLKLENKDEFVEYVIRRYDQDLQDRREWSQARLQRYAKLYGWLETKNYPWPNASNQHVPMLMTNSQRTQDTLVNAVMASRPVMSAIAINKADADKGKTIDELQSPSARAAMSGATMLPSSRTANPSASSRAWRPA